MAQVTITINSREYPIACESGQEARILQLAAVLEQKAQLLKHISGQINENMLLAMIGILVADDLLEARKNTPAATEPQISATETEQMIAEADRLIAERLRTVGETIKAVAKRIETL